MRRISAVFVSIVSVVGVLAACGGKDQPPANAPAPSASYVQPYPQQTGYPPQPGQPGYGPQPGATPPPGAPPAGQMAVPGPAALPCSNDSQCMTHRCNTQYGKCAFPCQSDADCIQGATCFVGGGAMAACLPKPAGQ